ncbi:MAG: hypothetical protein DME26_19890 [Verrucomicrobia bacterium]|nr:MAG: hypothetical protein DME26_19890 [Verrucomicrobiota bacterium]
MSLLAAAFVLLRNKPPAPDPLEPSSDRVVNTNAAPAAAVATMNVAQAVMVTVDLDFGPKLPSIAEALRDVERRHEPEDGVGRTFSIIEAFGEPTPEGKLRVSMHVSTEKPGMGALAFKRTGETLWRSRINAGTNHATANPPNSKNLTVFLDNLQGKTWVVDGSNNPDLLLAAHLRDSGLAVSSVWQDGVEMEVGFIYSSCGCPVKVRAKRMGDGTIRTKELPVIFPDDLAVVRVIEKLMRW